MKIRLHNARILTMNKDEEIFLGEVIVNNDRIEEVRKGSADDDNAAYDKVIDCKGNLLMPGFKNAHAHSGMSVLRSLADDKPLYDWLTQDIFPVEAKMTAEDIYWMSQLSALEYLTSGITACFDMYLDNPAMAKAMDDFGFRCVQVGGVNDFSDDLTKIERMYLSLNKPDSLQSYQLGYHAEYTTSLENHKKIAEIVQRQKAPLYVHACETKSEVEGCKERYGMTPVQFMDSLGLFDFGGGIYHGVHMSEEDFAVMKKRGLYVVTNPGSNTKLASGIAPITEYVKRGIPVAIGTDGPASNNCLDFFREMFLVAGLAKLHDDDAAALDAKEVLTMATVNGARAMLLKDCETLSAGQKADMIMIDLLQPNMQPINNIEKNIVYSGSKQNVKMTMINGRILYYNNEFFTDIAPMTIYEKVAEIKERLLAN
ncbi:MAG: amidohydrolase [Prevotella sp.]|nr:amidohydrolase [Candidatus Prevotella equi]